MSPSALVRVDLKGLLPKVASGKVRDLYAVDGDTLLFVASDRISAYDVVMKNVRLPPMIGASVLRADCCGRASLAKVHCLLQ